MFNDRDLFVLGAGAILSVSCLLLPLPFSWKVVLGALVLISFMILALMRLGPDRIPFEEWLRRRVRYRLQARRYTYQGSSSTRLRSPRWFHSSRGGRRGEHSNKSWRERLKRALHPPGQAGDLPGSQVAAAPIGAASPISLAFEEVGVYPLATAFLGVVGVYFLTWLAAEGAAEISTLLGDLIP